MSEEKYSSVDQEAVREEMGFSEQLAVLPKVMQYRFFRQICASMLVALLTLVIMLYFGNWSYSIGLLLSLYLAYAGFDLVWGFNSGRIVRKKVVVLKANIQKEYAAVSLRELDEEGRKADELYQLRLYGKKTDLAMLESNIVLDVYFRPGYTADVLAWEVVDFVG